MFPLKNKKIGGFKFGQKYPASFGTLAGHPHLGTDYTASTGTKLYAPFDGKIISSLTGTQGGQTLWFQAKGSTDIIRFMHLSKMFTIKKDVKEGDTIALTGNTGSASSAPHLHLDISKNKVDIYNINNFKDPETYKWEVEAPKVVKIAESVQSPTPTPIPPEIKVPTPVIETPPASIPSVTEDFTTYEPTPKEIPVVPANQYQEELEKLEKSLTPLWDKIINFIINKINTWKSK